MIHNNFKCTPWRIITPGELTGGVRTIKFVMFDEAVFFNLNIY